MTKDAFLFLIDVSGNDKRIDVQLSEKRRNKMALFMAMFEFSVSVFLLRSLKGE